MLEYKESAIITPCYTKSWRNPMVVTCGFNDSFYIGICAYKYTNVFKLMSRWNCCLDMVYAQQDMHLVLLCYLLLWLSHQLILDSYDSSPIFMRLNSLAFGQSYDCPGVIWSEKKPMVIKCNLINSYSWMNKLFSLSQDKLCLPKHVPRSVDWGSRLNYHRQASVTIQSITEFKACERNQLCI